jgi:hypothetical protein
MIDKNTHSLVSKILVTGLFAAGVLFGSTALACTTDGWVGGVTGTPLAGSPTPEGVARVSGVCAMELEGAGSVKDTSPTAEPTTHTRFYVKADAVSGSPVIYQAFSDDDAIASLVTVTFDGSNFVFDAGAGASANVPGSSGWNLVEMAWAGGGTMDYWVNVDAVAEPLNPTGTVNAAAGTMESIILGAPDSLNGFLTFDDYEMRRTSHIGRVAECDAEGDAANDDIDLNDALAVVDEIFAVPPILAQGSPDCELDGDVDLNDVLAIVDSVFP